MPGERLGIGRRCPRCGTFSDTLSRACPACGRRRIPAGAFWIALPVAIVVWVWLLTTDPVVGVALVGIAFIALVALIGLANSFAERR
jgi:uncharacterized OB-fold protein